MNDRVLFVDDEANLLRAIQRRLRKKFCIYTALSGREALKILKDQGPFAVIVSDMRMPEMNGIELLSKVKDIAPDTVRMMLTGNADQETAIRAVNEGNIFRFMNKPCSPDVLENAVRSGIEQYRLITAERELLDKTLKGSMQVMAEILSQVNPIAFSRTHRIKRYLSRIVDALRLPQQWEFSVAAFLSQIGCVTVPTDILEKVYAGIPLNKEEEKMFNSHPEVGARLLSKIPRLENVSAIIRLQRKKYEDFLGKPRDMSDRLIWLGAQILKAVIDYDQLVFMGHSHEKACEELRSRTGWYNPKILEILEGLRPQKESYSLKKVLLEELTPGMILNQDVVARNGLLLASKGQIVSYSVKERLINFSKTIGVEEPVLVLV